MATYVILSKMTDQGVKNIRDIRQTVQRNRANGERLGLKVIGWYMTQGRYDMVIIVEAPDDQAVAAQTLFVASAGNSHTETLRAFTLDEADQIIQKIG